MSAPNRSPHSPSRLSPAPCSPCPFRQHPANQLPDERTSTPDLTTPSDARSPIADQQKPLPRIPFQASQSESSLGTAADAQSSETGPQSVPPSAPVVSSNHDPATSTHDRAHQSAPHTRSSSPLDGDSKNPSSNTVGNLDPDKDVDGISEGDPGEERNQKKQEETNFMKKSTTALRNKFNQIVGTKGSVDFKTQGGHLGVHRVETPPQTPGAESHPLELATAVFFGTTGVGKSSVINMLPDAEANAPQATVSNSSSGVTTDARSYLKIIGGRRFRIYDTAGMGEGTAGTVPTHEAIQRFYDLLKGEKDGIHLIVFVIRGGRLTKMEENNHRLIKLLAPNVPLALVITGLEYEEDMEGWWEKQRDQFVKYDFAVDHHAPVVATRGKGNLLGQQYEDSQVKIRDLLSEATHHRRAVVVVEKQWFTSFHKEVQAVINDSGLGRGRILDFSEEIRKLLKKYQEKENASGRTMMRNPLARLRPNIHREDSSRRLVTE